MSNRHREAGEADHAGDAAPATAQRPPQRARKPGLDNGEHRYADVTSVDAVLASSPVGIAGVPLRDVSARLHARQFARPRSSPGLVHLWRRPPR